MQNPAAVDVLPEHLPLKLCISCWIWSWITSATPEEPYGDLERCMIELKERGFNCVRVEAGLNWAFLPDGTPRGEMDFGQWIAGHGWNFSTVGSRGGGRHDVLRRVIRLLELAQRHDIYVILTSWEYQDSSWFVADPEIRASVYAVAPEERFMQLARLHDRLLTILKRENLHRNIAFVEVHNEPEHSEFPSGDEGRRLHRDAIGFLRERHPDILVAGDFSSHNDDIVPDNTQIYDQHVYAGGQWYFEDLYGLTVRHPEFDPANPRATEAVDRVLRDDVIPWDEFMVPAANIRPAWRDVMWLYENLDNDKWDKWVAERFAVWEDRIMFAAREMFAGDAAHARRRGLPLVIDEGGLFYPPGRSRFEISQKGLSVLDLFADLAIEHEYWGFMPGTYCGAEHIVWRENPQWLRSVNDRFRDSVRG
jgi:hypothetical protein